MRRCLTGLIKDHFHVHVVHIEHEGLAGMTVGQAHLLDDLISLVSPRPAKSACLTDDHQLELSPPGPEPSIITRMTFTYALGVEHGLYAGLAEDDTA
jgi:m7GpppX diphosphatase